MKNFYNEEDNQLDDDNIDINDNEELPLYEEEDLMDVISEMKSYVKYYNVPIFQKCNEDIWHNFLNEVLKK